MAGHNQQVVERFFSAYSKHDVNKIREVMDDSVTWYFPGDHPLAGTKKGIDEVLSFFDAAGAIMMKSNVKVDKLIEEENDRYFIECQHITTNRTDGNNIDHYASVLWTIENGKIIEGRHFFNNQEAVNKYFSAVAQKQKG